MNEWTPAAILALIAFLANQFVNWHKERRDQRRETRDDVTSDDLRYKSQVEGVIAALERRVLLAETAEAECTAAQKGQEDRIMNLEKMVDRLSRKLAVMNGETG